LLDDWRLPSLLELLLDDVDFLAFSLAGSTSSAADWLAGGGIGMAVDWPAGAGAGIGMGIAVDWAGGGGMGTGIADGAS
jgi:hypothetical protein